ncbi:hypothetical protein ABT160_12090 [Streptomyces sp. NPDC001941]|uniref:hypothetical protein n=1 Tax=Streptomyces sp. NPDC001941 TaxID=3154659 RepID=UPI003329B2E7
MARNAGRRREAVTLLLPVRQRPPARREVPGRERDSGCASCGRAHGGTGPVRLTPRGEQVRLLGLLLLLVAVPFASAGLHIATGWRAADLPVQSCALALACLATSALWRRRHVLDPASARLRPTRPGMVAVAVPLHACVTVWGACDPWRVPSGDLLRSLLLPAAAVVLNVAVLVALRLSRGPRQH